MAEYAFLKVYSDYPGLFVVNGLGEGGLPTSLQFTGRAGAEGMLLELGMQVQARTTHHRLRPAGF